MDYGQPQLSHDEPQRRTNLHERQRRIVAIFEILRTYYQLTKPGIIRGNILVTAAGFLLACAPDRYVDIWLLAALLIGTSLVIASACVFNNYIDRNIDKKMTRTKQRALVSGVVSGRQALSYATVLGILGFGILVAFTNFLVVLIGLVAFVMYVAVYGYFKRRSSYGTLVGSIPGALPPVAGYVAVTGRFDVGALLLFLVLVYWQMAHFYAIALYRLKDYRSAGIPVMPAVSGVRTTKQQILLYIIAFMLINVAFTTLGYAGAAYATIMSMMGLIWLYLGVRGFNAKDDKAWGRSMFLFSLIIILGLSIMLSIGGLIV